MGFEVGEKMLSLARFQNAQLSGMPIWGCLRSRHLLHGLTSIDSLLAGLCPISQTRQAAACTSKRSILQRIYFMRSRYWIPDNEYQLSSRKSDSPNYISVLPQRVRLPGNIPLRSLLVSRVRIEAPFFKSSWTQISPVSHARCQRSSPLIALHHRGILDWRGYRQDTLSSWSPKQDMHDSSVRQGHYEATPHVLSPARNAFTLVERLCKTALFRFEFVGMWNIVSPVCDHFRANKMFAWPCHGDRSSSSC